VKAAGAVKVAYDASRIPAQSAFHAALESRRFGLFLGGRQGGKTTAGAHQCWREIARAMPPKLGWIIGPTYKQAEQAEADFLSVCPEAIVRRREYGDKREYDIANGYKVEIRTADDPDALRGKRLGWYWIDEIALVKQAVVEVLYPNLLAYRGKMWGTTTPRGRNWLYDDFYLRSLPHSRSYDPEYFCIKSRTYDNPFVDARDVAKLAQKYSGAFRAQEIDAEFVNFEGLVYRDFDVMTHVVNDLEPDDADVDQVIAGIDFGFKDPFCYLWVAHRRGGWVVVDEHYEAERETLYHARVVRSNPWEKRVSVRFADPRGKQSRIDLMRYGLPNIAAHKHDIYDGVIEVTRLLNARLQDGRPALQVCRKCKNLIREFGQYRYRDEAPERNVGEKPLEYMNHALDCVRYALFSVGSGLYHGSVETEQEPPRPGDYGYILDHHMGASPGHQFLSRNRAAPFVQHGVHQSIWKV